MVQRCAGVSEAKRSVRYSCGESKQSTADGFDEEPQQEAFCAYDLVRKESIRAAASNYRARYTLSASAPKKIKKGMYRHTKTDANPT